MDFIEAVTYMARAVGARVPENYKEGPGPHPAGHEATGGKTNSLAGTVKELNDALEEQRVDVSKVVEAAVEATTPKARRGRKPAVAKVEIESADETVTEVVKPKVRRGRKPAVAKVEEAPVEIVEAPRTSRRGRKPAAKAVAPVTGEISLEDLSKAASDVAAKFAPDTVFKFLQQEWGVKKVNDVPEEGRELLLHTLLSLMVDDEA